MYGVSLYACQQLFCYCLGEKFLNKYERVMLGEWKKMSNYNDKRQGYKLLIIALILGGIVIILYWRYLTGEYLFLFPNVVNDGMTQFFPRYLKLAR